MLSKLNLIRRGAPGALLTPRAWTTSAIVRPRVLGPGLCAMAGERRVHTERRALDLMKLDSFYTMERYIFGGCRLCGRCNDPASVSLFICGRSYA